MMDISFLNNVFFYLVLIIGTCLAIFVYFTNPKEKVNQLFLLFTFFNLLLIVFTYFSDILNLSTQINLAILFRKLAYGTGFLFFVTTYFFVRFFPFKTKEFPFWDAVVLILGIGFFLTSIFSNLVVKGVEIRSWGNSPVFGRGILYAYGAIVFLTFLILGTLIQKYFKLPVEQKLKTQYFLTGVIIFTVGNFVFNVMLAPQWYDFPYYYFGNYSAIFLFGFTAYAIVKRELFGIKVVITSLFVGLIAVVLLIQILIAQTLLWRIINSVVLILFIIFGHFLINYTHRETKQKEILEQKVAERTKELELAKNVAENRAKEIERWYRATIGRELRMIELKKEIKELEEEVKKKQQI